MASGHSERQSNLIEKLNMNIDAFLLVIIIQIHSVECDCNVVLVLLQHIISY